MCSSLCQKVRCPLERPHPERRGGHSSRRFQVGSHGRPLSLAPLQRGLPFRHPLQKGLVFSRSTKGGEYALQSQRDLRRGSFPSCRNDSFSGGAMAVETSYTTFPLKWIGIWRVPHEPWFDAVVCREIGNELPDGLGHASPEGAVLG